jgi:hypothetical protein
VRVRLVSCGTELIPALLMRQSKCPSGPSSVVTLDANNVIDSTELVSHSRMWKFWDLSLRVSKALIFSGDDT